jgi:hypothetical protein
MYGEVGKGKNLGGSYKTKPEAERRLRQLMRLAKRSGTK